MLKDIPELKVEDVGVAVVREKNKQGEDEWNVYLINFKNDIITGVLVSSTGYGNINEEKRRSSTLRHFLDEVPGRSFSKIEPIVEEVFALTNEYWVSFVWQGKMYDKKYIFLPESISEGNMIEIPIMHKPGVLIR